MIIRNMSMTFDQVPRAQKASWKTFGLLLYRIGLLLVWTVFSLPGVVLHAPIFVTASVVSKRKAKGSVLESCMFAFLRCSYVSRGSRRISRKGRGARRPRNVESFDLAGHDPGPLYLLRNSRDRSCFQDRRTLEVDSLDALSCNARTSVHWLCSPQVR